MSLTNQEKSDLAQQIALLIEADEPEAILAELERIAIRKAIDGLAPQWQRDRWRALKRGLEEARAIIRDDKPRRAETSQQLNEANEATQHKSVV